MRKVYVVSPSYHDYSSAEEYGELIYLSEQTLNKFATTSMMRLFESGLENSSPEDYILIAGAPVMTILASSVFAVKHGRLNLLLFKASASGNKYEARTIIMEKEGVVC